jgi:hypothetical protein
MAQDLDQRLTGTRAAMLAGELDEEALTRAARRAAVNAVLYAANPAPF